MSLSLHQQEVQQQQYRDPSKVLPSLMNVTAEESAASCSFDALIPGSSEPIMSDGRVKTNSALTSSSTSQSSTPTIVSTSTTSTASTRIMSIRNLFGKKRDHHSKSVAASSSEEQFLELEGGFPTVEQSGGWNEAIAPVFRPPSPSLLRDSCENIQTNVDPIGNSTALTHESKTTATKPTTKTTTTVSTRPPLPSTHATRRDLPIAMKPQILFFDEENKENIPPINKNDDDLSMDHSNHFLSVNTSLDLPDISDDDPFFPIESDGPKPEPLPIRCTWHSLEVDEDGEVQADAEFLKELEYHAEDVTSPARTHKVDQAPIFEVSELSPVALESRSENNLSILSDEGNEQGRLSSKKAARGRVDMDDEEKVKQAESEPDFSETENTPSTAAADLPILSSQEKMRRALDAYYNDRALQQAASHSSSSQDENMAWLEQLASSYKKVVINDEKTQVRIFHRSQDEKNTLFKGKRGMRKYRRGKKSRYAAAAAAASSSLADKADDDDGAPRGWAEEFKSILSQQIQLMGESSWMLKDSLAKWTEEFLENDKYQYQRDLFTCKAGIPCAQPPPSTCTQPACTTTLDGTEADLDSICTAPPEFSRTYSSPPIRIANSNSFSSSDGGGSVQSESAVQMASFRRPLKRKDFKNKTLPRRSNVTQDILIQPASTTTIFAAADSSEGVENDTVTATTATTMTMTDSIEMSLVEAHRPMVPVEHKRRVVANARRWAAQSQESKAAAKHDEMKRIEDTFHQAYKKLLNLSVIAEESEHSRQQDESTDSILDLFRPWNGDQKVKTPSPAKKKTTSKQSKSPSSSFKSATSFFQQLESSSNNMRSPVSVVEN